MPPRWAGVRWPWGQGPPCRATPAQGAQRAPRVPLWGSIEGGGAGPPPRAPVHIEGGTSKGGAGPPPRAPVHRGGDIEGGAGPPLVQTTCLQQKQERGLSPRGGPWGSWATPGPRRPLGAKGLRPSRRWSSLLAMNYNPLGGRGPTTTVRCCNYKVFLNVSKTAELSVPFSNRICGALYSERLLIRDPSP